MAQKNVAFRLEIQIEEKEMTEFIGWTMVTLGCILVILILSTVLGDRND